MGLFKKSTQNIKKTNSPDPKAKPWRETGIIRPGEKTNDSRPFKSGSLG